VADTRGGQPPAPWGGAVASERAHAGPQVKGGGGRSSERMDKASKESSGGANRVIEARGILVFLGLVLSPPILQMSCLIDPMCSVQNL